MSEQATQEKQKEVKTTLENQEKQKASKTERTERIKRTKRAVDGTKPDSIKRSKPIRAFTSEFSEDFTKSLIETKVPLENLSQINRLRVASYKIVKYGMNYEAEEKAAIDDIIKAEKMHKGQLVQIQIRLRKLTFAMGAPGSYEEWRLGERKKIELRKVITKEREKIKRRERKREKYAAAKALIKERRRQELAIAQEKKNAQASIPILVIAVEPEDCFKEPIDIDSPQISYQSGFSPIVESMHEEIAKWFIENTSIGGNLSDANAMDYEPAFELDNPLLPEFDNFEF